MIKEYIAISGTLVGGKDNPVDVHCERLEELKREIRDRDFPSLSVIIIIYNYNGPNSAGAQMVNLSKRYTTTRDFHYFQYQDSFLYSFLPLINNNHSHSSTHPTPPQKVLFTLSLYSLLKTLFNPTTL